MNWKSNITLIIILFAYIGCSPQEEYFMWAPKPKGVPIEKRAGTDYLVREQLDRYQLPFSEYLYLKVRHDINSYMKGWEYVTPELLYQFSNIQFLSLGDKSPKRISIKVPFYFSKFPELREVCINPSSSRPGVEFYDDLFTSAKHLKGAWVSGLKRLPECLCEYDNLEWLVAWGNYESLEVPDCFKNMSKLKYLKLSGYGILDPTVMEIGSLEYLEVAGAFPGDSVDVSEMPNIKALRLGFTNQLNFTESINQASKLELIYFARVAVSFPEKLSNSSLIKFFGGMSSIDVLPSFEGCTNLRQIHLRSCAVDSMINGYKGLKELRSFVMVFGNNEKKQIDFPDFSGADKLEEITLFNNYFPNSMWKGFHELKNLKVAKFNARAMPIEDQLYVARSGIPRLYTFFSENVATTMGELIPVHKDWPTHNNVTEYGPYTYGEEFEPITYLNERSYYWIYLQRLDPKDFHELYYSHLKNLPRCLEIYQN